MNQPRNTRGTSCGHRIIPIAISEVFADCINEVFCPSCNKWMPYVKPKDIPIDMTIELFTVRGQDGD